MKLSEKQIKEIADNLDCGMICYVNRETKEIITMIDFDNFDADTELWEEEFEEIQENIDKYLKMEKMDSRAAFEIMEAFANQVENVAIQNKLFYALNKSKPFRNFKFEVDYNEDVRQQWFKFKEMKYQDWVKTYLKHC